MQHGHGDDEGQKEPVRHIDMTLAPVQDRTEEHGEVGQPDDGQPDVDIPLRLGIFLRLGRPQQIARRRQYDEQLIAPENKPSSVAAPKPCRRRTLHDVKRRGDQRIAAKGEDHRAGVQRTQTAKVGIGLRPFDIQRGKGELKGDVCPRKEPDNTPERRGNYAIADRPVHIALRRWRMGRGDTVDRHIAQLPEEQAGGDHHDQQRMDHIGRIPRPIGRQSCEKHNERKHDQLERIEHIPNPLYFGTRFSWRQGRCLDLDQMRHGLGRNSRGQSIGGCARSVRPAPDRCAR